MNIVFKIIILSASVFVIINVAVKQSVHVTCSQTKCKEKVNLDDLDVKKRINQKNEKNQARSEQSKKDGQMTDFNWPEFVRIDCKDTLKRKNYR